MKKVFFVVLAIVLMLGVFLSVNISAQAAKPADYFPLKVGNFWVYEVTGAKLKLVIKVTGMEKVDNKNCYRVETSINNSPILIEYMYKSGNDVFENKIIKIDEEKMTAILLKPEKKILTNPLTTGDVWVYKGKDISSANSVQTKKVLNEETVNVPAGTFKAMLVKTNTVENGMNLNKTAWYAAGVGPVKSISHDKKSVVLMQYVVK